ncbi:GntR family transcriptional regulator [Rhodobacter sp. Har01]|uniref:GntR family transcriptional regulator n=1 Tax=Rhodobacter sp. Har01 TaxID=2883999 RepID=UPI001D09765D|nr:GntR family transcriptional regulator [Rhodobacter sp. Har01]MCB6176718.1 GntR family transcriptional regulator [Rhodobacter sp. Har01]
MSAPVGLAKSEQVARTLERDIREGRLGNGALLQSEVGLMRRFEVSRNTVRRGLEILARQGLITTRTGIGSFVTYDGIAIDSSLGWTVALSQGDGAVETRLLAISAGSSRRADARLGGSRIYLRIDRLRFCLRSGQGISLERSRLPWRDGFAPVLEAGLKDGSLNATLAEHGLAVAAGEEVVGVVPALSPVDAGIMQRAAGAPMLRLERVTRIASGEVLEYVDSILDPGRFGLRIAF